MCLKKERKKKCLSLFLESELGNNRQRAVFITINGSHEVLFVILQYTVSKLLFAVFCRSKTSKFLRSSFVLYLFYIIIQVPVRYSLWTEVTFHLGCPKCRAGVSVTNLKEALTNIHKHSVLHTARAVVQHASCVSQLIITPSGFDN